MQSYDEQANLISFEYMLKFGDKFINSCVLINGGAIIAILAFVGSIFDRLSILSLHLIGFALLFFTFGLLLSVFAFAISFKTQEKVTWSGSDRLKQKSAEERRQFAKLALQPEGELRSTALLDVLGKKINLNERKRKRWRVFLEGVLIASIFFFVFGTTSAYFSIFYSQQTANQTTFSGGKIQKLTIKNKIIK